MPQETESLRKQLGEAMKINGTLLEKVKRLEKQLRDAYT